MKFAGIQNPDASGKHPGRIRTHPDASGIGTSSAESSAFCPAPDPLSSSARSRASRPGQPAALRERGPLFTAVHKADRTNFRTSEGSAVERRPIAASTSSGRLALDFRSGALPLPFSGHSISFARLPVLLFSGHLPVFPRENAFSNDFQKNAAFWKNPENIWLKSGQNSAKFWEILQNFVKISEIFSDF